MDYVLKILPQILEGLGVTLKVFIFTFILSIPCGVIVALGRLAKNKIINLIFGIYVTILRSTPLLLQLLFIYYGLPIIGIEFERFTAVLIAFVINYSAYFGEIFRAGIKSIDEGQYEAGEVLGLNKKQIFFTIVLPQAFKRVIPPIANEVVTLVKDTALISILGLEEMLKVANIASNRDVTMVPYLAVGVVYLIVIGIMSKAMEGVERKYDYYK